DALREQEAIDKALYQGKLRRWNEEEKERKKAEQAQRKSISSINDEERALNNLLGQIDPVTRNLQRLAKLEQDLTNLRDKGKINLDQYTRYQGVIDATREKVTRYNTELNKTGITA